MSEQGDLGDIIPEISTPQPSEVPLRADEVIDEEAGYQVVSSRLKAGGVVLLGDTHFKDVTHTLFQQYEERLIAEGVPFALAVELPYLVNYQINERITEQILQQADALYRNNGGELDKGYAKRLAVILDLAKQHNIPIRAIDNIDFFKHSLPAYLAGQDRNGWMARQLKELSGGGGILLY